VFITILTKMSRRQTQPANQTTSLNLFGGSSQDDTQAANINQVHQKGLNMHSDNTTLSLFSERDFRSDSEELRKVSPSQDAISQSVPQVRARGVTELSLFSSEEKQ
jgi:hypothetical protein